MRLGLLILLVVGSGTRALGDCSVPPAVDAVIAAVFDGVPTSCDLNDDGTLSAADVPAGLASVPTPGETAPPSRSPTASETATAPPTATATSTPTPSPTASVTPSPTVTPTVTPGQCAGEGADLEVEVDNATGVSPVSVTLSGTRVGLECTTATLETSYQLTVTCDGSGVSTCGRLSGLAPGSWSHTIQVTAPATQQLQHQPGLLVAGSLPNRVRFTAFAATLTVRTTANSGAGSLRNALQLALAPPQLRPLLVQFDPAAFPDGVPTRITLAFQLPALASNDITIDGTDATGASGNRIVDAAGLSIPALVITGAANHIVGLRLTNTGGNDRDTLSINGPAADANLIERTIIENSASADAVGIDDDAGKDFDDTANVLRACEVRGAADKGVKVTTGSYARIEGSWVHDNANGGIQATLGGHVQAWHNLVERNRGSTAQNGLSVNARDDNVTPTSSSELRTWGNISRRNGANGMSVRASVAEVRDDYLATNGTSGIRVFNDVGAPASAYVTGTSAVCNAVDGAVVANTSHADFGGGALGSPGNNAFTQNNLPGGGANLRNATGIPVSAVNDQWEHCGPLTTCNDTAIANFDLSDHGAKTPFTPAQAQRSLQPPELTGTVPNKGQQGELLRIFGAGFNVIDGHFAEDNCADVVGRNRCAPLRGNCVLINDVPAQVEAVTPTMLVVRWPFSCTEPVPLTVTTDQGPTGATSAPIMVCVNDTPVPTPPAPTATPTNTPESTPTATNTLEATPTLTDTPESTPTPTDTETPVA